MWGTFRAMRLSVIFFMATVAAIGPAWAETAERAGAPTSPAVWNTSMSISPHSGSAGTVVHVAAAAWIGDGDNTAPGLPPRFEILFRDAAGVVTDFGVAQPVHCDWRGCAFALDVTIPADAAVGHGRMLAKPSGLPTLRKRFRVLAESRAR
jgi:hypothetical protein